MASFGETRELAFLHCSNDNVDKQDPGSIERGFEQKRTSHLGTSGGVRLYLPHGNNCVVSYGRAVNANWKHGVNALPEHDNRGTDARGTFTVVLWGRARGAVEDPLSDAVAIAADAPPLKSKADEQRKKSTGKKRNNKRKRRGDT